MDVSALDLVRPLETAENHFLQVLISRFTLKRTPTGSHLDLRFDAKTPAIWLRRAKPIVQAAMRSFARKAERYQRELDEYLLQHRRPTYKFNDPAFWFRWGSGGALPLLRSGTRDYYCLFYRDAYPVGWNIANGGCDTLDELLHPIQTIEREFREELIVIDPRRSLRYVLAEDARRPLDHPDFAAALREWQHRAKAPDLERFTEREIPLKWSEGPDSLTISFGTQKPRTIGGVFLNINALDFGIEVDRIALMRVDPDAILCDGEMQQGKLLNRIVGLFEVDKLHRALHGGASEFRPDVFFFNARQYEGRLLDTIVEKEYLPSVRALRSPQERRASRQTHDRFDLCPVTRRLVIRHAAMTPPTDADDPGKCDVFVSHAQEDRSLAKQVTRFLRTDSHKRVFFTGDDGDRDSNFTKAIDHALESARHLVVVASDPTFLRKDWVGYEYRSFHNLILSGRKKGGQLIPLVSGFDPKFLPLPLLQWDAVLFERRRPRAGLQRLAKLVTS